MLNNFIFNIILLNVIQLLSRLLGLFRESAISSLIGTGSDHALYTVSEKIPKFLYGILFDGLCLQLVFPILARYKRKIKSGLDQGLEQNFLGFVTFIFFVVVLFSIMFTPLLSAIFCPGWFLSWFIDNTKDNNLFTDANYLVKLLIPGFMFLSVASLLGISLNLRKSYLTTALFPVIINFSFIIACYIKININPVYLLVITFNVSTFICLLLQLISFKMFKIKYNPFTYNFDFHKKSISSFIKSSPLVLVSSFILQFTISFPTIISTFLITNYLSYIHYSSKVADFFIVPFRAGIMSLLPAILSEKFREIEKGYDSENNNIKSIGTFDFGKYLYLSLKNLLVIMVPIVIWGSLNSKYIIYLIYKSPHMSDNDIYHISNMLPIFLISFLIQSISKVLSIACYASKDVYSTMKATIYSLLTQFIISILSIFTSPYMICFGSLVGFLTEMIMLIRVLKSKKLFIHFDCLLRDLLLVLVNSFFTVMFYKKFLFNIFKIFLNKNSDIINLIINFTLCSLIYLIIFYLLKIMTVNKKNKINDTIMINY